jgi:hypothetical protein
MKKLLIGLMIAAASGIAACQPQDEHKKLRKDMNGMILGDDAKPVQALYVGVGDTATRLMEHNPYLRQFKLRDQEELRLPLMTKLDVHYDDGDIKLDVGCALTTNVDGNARFPGVAFIGIKLCDQPLNDWRPALQRATEIMQKLEQRNLQVQNLRDFYLNASEPELQKVGGDIWQRSTHDIDQLLTLEEANAKFLKESNNGNVEILSGKRSNTYAYVGVYASKYTIFEIGISKTANFGGDNLTEAQRQTMRYEITMSFRLRNDINPMAIQR